MAFSLSSPLLKYKLRSLSAVSTILGATILPVLFITKVYAVTPVISAVTANTILTSSAVITWNTDVPADAQVEYGTAISYGSVTTLDMSLLQNHSQTLSGLQTNTLYHFRVKSHDSTGTLAVSGDNVFVTALGYSAVGNLLDSGDTNVMNANRFVTVSGGKVVSLSAHVGPVGAAPNNQYQMAIYNDNGGVPGTLVANTGTGSLTANAWNTLPLLTTPTLLPNTTYYITYNTNGGDTALNNLHYINAATTALKWKTATFGTWPSSFGTITSQETMTQSVFASFVPVDSTAPSVAITSPANGSTVSGSVNLTANATDDVAVASVQFKRNGVNLGAAITNPPYTTTWNTAANISGTDSITAVASDAAGNTTTSSPISITTNNPAHVRFAQPINGQTIAATDVVVNYLKSGNIVAGDGQHAHLRLDGGSTKMDLDFDGTYTFTGVPAGAHTLEIVVADVNHIEEPNSGETISFTTTTPDVTPPAVSITAPADGTTVSNTVALHATASDTESGVAKVQFWLDATRMLAETTTGNPDYTTNLDTTTISNGTHTLMARAIDNAFNQTDSATISINVQNADPRSSVGEWGPVTSLPIVPVHMSLLHTGELLMWDAWDITSPPRLWNMTTNTFTSLPVPQIGSYELFCAGQATTGTGELVVAGGHDSNGVGTNTLYMFNPDTRSWTKKINMSQVRWYPSVTQMSDNRMMVIGGQSSMHIWAETPEIFNTQNNTVQALTNINTSAVDEIEYPQSTMMPGGKILSISAEHGPMMVLDPSNSSWTQVGTTQVPFGAWTSFAPGKYLITGGGVFNESQQGSPSQKIARVLDMTSASPVWTNVPDMSEPRSYHNITMLPTGKAIVIGGSHIVSDGSQPSDGAYSSEIWDPATNTWSSAGSITRPRMYHSVSMLLPDGRVLSAGGGRLSPMVDELNAQIYSPGYLFRGARPTISSAPTTAQHNSTMDFVSPDAANITKVTLSSLGSVTHTADWNQHFMDLSFTRNGNTLTINTPTSSNIIPEGYYMIFLVNSDGVPSQAQIIRLATPDTSAPTVSISAPAANATVKGTVAINATASDNIGVTGVQFKLDGNNLGTEVTQPPFTYSWNTTTIADGVHTLTAVARDLAGNVTTSSAVTVTVANADTAAPAVSMTSPANGATVSGTISPTATATDDVGVVGVQFMLDGAALGAEDTTSPYATTWNTASVSNGTHVLSAVARDAAGNKTTASSVSVTVANGVPDTTPPFISAVNASAITASTATITWTTDESADSQVEYGTTTAYGSSTAIITTGVTSHSQGLSALNPSTLYHYRVKSRDAAGNLAVSVDFSFTTAASTANNGLVAAYNFNAGTGSSLADISGNGNNGSIYQAVWTTAGKFGSALTFDGSNDVVTVNDSNSLHLTTGVTVEAWVKPSSISGWRTILMKEYPSNLSYALYASDGNAPPAFYGNVTSEVSALGKSKLTLNSWTHVSGTYDGTNLKIYVNGTLVTTRALSGALRTSTSPLKIGGNASWTGEYFAGQIDEVRVYNRALSQSEIQANMNQPL